jgi:hypothetical protein
MSQLRRWILQASQTLILTFSLGEKDEREEEGTSALLSIHSLIVTSPCRGEVASVSGG